MQLDLQENASKICRTCLRRIDSKGLLFNLDASYPSNETSTIRHKLTDYIPEIDLTIVPIISICSDCCSTIDSAYRFKKQCLETEKVIRMYLQIPKGTFENVIQLFGEKERSCISAAEIKSEPSQVKDENVSIKEEPDDDCVEVSEYYPEAEPQNQENMDNRLNSPGGENEHDFPGEYFDGQHFLSIQSSAQYSDSKESGAGNPERDVEVKKKVRYKCELCGFNTSRNSSFAIHMKIHSKQIFNKCIDCNFVGQSKVALNLHTKAHMKPSVYKCGLCNYTSSKKTPLREHIKKIHKPEKPYRCAKCMYSTISSSSLEKHMKIHSIKCDMCNYSSIYLSAIKVHMRTHTGEKPYKCTKCDYRAGQMGTLKGHMQTHDNECHLCGFRTKTELRLLDHMVWHTKKPNTQYKCTKKYASDNSNTCNEASSLNDTDSPAINDISMCNEEMFTHHEEHDDFSDANAYTTKNLHSGVNVEAKSGKASHNEGEISRSMGIYNTDDANKGINPALERKFFHNEEVLPKIHFSAAESYTDMNASNAGNCSSGVNNTF